MRKPIPRPDFVLGARSPAQEEQSQALWAMSPAQRVAAMRRGELGLQQLAEWSQRHPEEVPRINGELWWIAVTTPEVAERRPGGSSEDFFAELDELKREGGLG